MVAKKESANLNARASKASDKDEPKASRASAVKPKNELLDLEPVRFSRRQDLEKHDSPSAKILVYIVVVIVVGVGLTLLVQRFITNQNAGTPTDTDVATTPPAQPDVVIPNATIASATLSDSAATNVVNNDAFTISDLSLGSAANDVSTVNIAQLKYEPFSSFTRMSWVLEGLKNGLPATKINYNSLTNVVTVTFSGVTNVDEGFLQDIKPKVGNINNIRGAKDGNGVTFTLTLNGSAKYFAAITGGNTVSLDIKNEAQLSQPATTATTPTPAPAPTPTPTPAPTPVADSGAPAAPHFQNTSSQNKQYISSNVTGNTINFTTSYWDASVAGFYEYSWAMQGKADTSVPNATAELKQAADGSYYIEVKINNLAYDVVSARNKTTATLMYHESSSVTEIELKSFTGGTSTYWVKLKKKANFRLRATETTNDDGGYRLLGLQVAN